ncbi:MAG: hypothetical protein PVJ49_09145 [Acidobacteriota bacterium]|jgi:hypothetical protein
MERIRSLLGRDGIPLAAAVLALVLTLPALWAGFLFDDYAMRLMLSQHPDAIVGPGQAFSVIDGDPSVNLEMMGMGILPWWTAPGLRLKFLRPLTILTHELDYALWPDTPALMHLHSLLWYAVLVGLAALLYRRLVPGPAWIGGLAALLYAIDDAGAYPAAWLANRNAVVAAAFGLAAVLLHDRWRRDRWRHGAWLAPLCLGLSLFSAEFGLATLGYLVAYALFLERRANRHPTESGAGSPPAPAWRRLASLAPYAPPLAAWLIVYRLGGYGTDASGFYFDPLRQPLMFLGALAERAPILMLGEWAMPYADAYNALSGADALVLWLRAAGLLALLAIVLTPLVRRSPSARFWAAGMLLALVPISAVAPSNRLLLFVGLGAMGLLAQFLGGLAERAEWLPTARPWRWVSIGMAGLLLLVHLVAAPLLHPIVPMALPMLDAPVRAAMLSIPDDTAVADQTLVIVNAPDHLIFVTLLWPMRLLADLPMAPRVYALATEPVEAEVSRTSPRSLTVDVDGGLFQGALGWLFRGPDHPLQVGQSIDLDGITVSVTTVTPCGAPRAAVFTFDRPLEDRSLRWLRWDDGVFVPFDPPAIGEHVTLPRPSNPLDAQGSEMLENYRQAMRRIEAGR